MNQPSSRVLQDGARFYQKEYGYLPARGYEFVTAEEAFLGWQIDVRKADLFMRILYTRGEDYISFRTAAQPPDEFVDLQVVIYAATGEHLRMEGNDAKVLPKYTAVRGDQLEMVVHASRWKMVGKTQAARHAKVQQQQPAVQVEQQVLSATPDCQHGSPDQVRRPTSQGPAQRLAKRDRQDARTCNAMRKTHARDFDFWQLRHGQA